MNLLARAAIFSGFVSHSDSYFMDLFNSWHLTQKQISGFTDLQYPAVDVYHFSPNLHIQWRGATTIKVNAVTSLKWTESTEHIDPHLQALNLIKNWVSWTEKIATSILI